MVASSGGCSRSIRANEMLDSLALLMLGGRDPPLSVDSASVEEVSCEDMDDFRLWPVFNMLGRLCSEPWCCCCGSGGMGAEMFWGTNPDPDALSPAAGRYGTWMGLLDFCEMLS